MTEERVAKCNHNVINMLLCNAISLQRSRELTIGFGVQSNRYMLQQFLPVFFNKVINTKRNQHNKQFKYEQTLYTIFLVFRSIEEMMEPIARLIFSKSFSPFTM